MFWTHNTHIDRHFLTTVLGSAGLKTDISVKNLTSTFLDYYIFSILIIDEKVIIEYIGNVRNH